MSLHTANSSANRGACTQNCRKTYTVKDKETGHEFDIDNEYIMSPKDLCTIGFIDQVLDAGVTVLKLEGRGRAPEYVKTTTRCYREAADAYLNNTYNGELVKGWMSRLETVYNRGFWDGYYLGQKLGEFSGVSGSKSTKKKIFVSKTSRYYPKLGVAEFDLVTGTLKKGDTILITGKVTGVFETIIDEIHLDRELVAEVKKGDHFSLKLSESVRVGDRLYKVVDTEYA